MGIHCIKQVQNDIGLCRKVNQLWYREKVETPREFDN